MPANTPEGIAHWLAEQERIQRPVRTAPGVARTLVVDAAGRVVAECAHQADADVIAAALNRERPVQIAPDGSRLGTPLKDTVHPAQFAHSH